MIVHPKKIPGCVSVIVPCYNRQHFLRETLRSILRQSHSKIQLIVVDDGSNDNSLGVARSAIDSRVTVLSRKHCGKAPAVNAALSLAQGEWVTVFDSDDLMTPRSLENRIRFLRTHSKAMAVMGRVGRLISRAGQALSQRHPIFQTYRGIILPTLRQSQRLWGGVLPEALMCQNNPLCPIGATLMRREAVEATGRFNEKLRIIDDMEYAVRMATIQPIAFLDRSVLWYRVHSGNWSFHFRGRQLLADPSVEKGKRRIRRQWASGML